MGLNHPLRSARHYINAKRVSYRSSMSTGSEDLFGKRWRELLPSPAVVASVILVLAAWQYLSTLFPSYNFPGLVHLVNAIWLIFTGGTDYNWVANYSVTLIRILLGFVIVMVLGSIVGVFMGTSSVFEDYISTFTVVMLTVPSVIWAFLAVMWFGLTEYVVPVFVISVIILPYVIVNMWQGTKDVDAELLEMASAFKFSRREVWRHIYIPHLTPYTFSTMRLAFAISWKLSLVAEIFGSSTGVGVIVNNYYQTFQTDMILAWALPMMVLMLGVEQIFEYLEQRSYRWQPDAESDTTDIEGEAV